MWQFLADHVHHRVHLLGESPAAWDEVGPEFVEIGGGDLWYPTLEEYAAGWPALPLMSAPRPLAEAVHRAVEEVSPRLSPHLWSPDDSEATAIRHLRKVLTLPAPPGEATGPERVAARLAKVRQDRDEIRGTADALGTGVLAELLRTVADLLAPLDDLPAENLRPEAAGIVPAALYDAERATGFLNHHLNGVATADRS
ncbi:hypothetical protein [Streptomyces sp. NPDC021562]|uniref:hypothetical protein n=1 Tax=Streptomyces sp. NPDC021562 TaxID=3155121 RepID=UPI0033DD4B66